MAADGTIIRRVLDAWGAVPHALLDVFATHDPDEVAAAVSEFCAAHLAAPVERYEFFDGGGGSVHGVRLVDGRRVAIKAHRPDIDIGYFEAVQHVQSAVADAGLPAPRPLLGPTRIGRGVAIVEELLDAGVPTPAHAASQRARMARDLRRFVAIATPHRARFGEHRGFLTGIDTTLYPPPHDRRFDLALPGGEWIDELAAQSQKLLRSWEGSDVVGHGDWRVQNLRYDTGRLSAIYDWDSVVARPEAALVGAVAGVFTTDWRTPDTCRVPSAAEASAFVTDYETARQQPFSSAERALARAALTYVSAYAARCQWSDLLTGVGRRPASVPPAEIPGPTYLTLLADLTAVGH